MLIADVNNFACDTEVVDVDSTVATLASKLAGSHFKESTRTVLLQNVGGNRIYWARISTGAAPAVADMLYLEAGDGITFKIMRRDAERIYVGCDAATTSKLGVVQQQ